MKLTTSRKIYAAVLGLGLCALAYDQLGGGGDPAAAVADTGLLAEAVRLADGPTASATPVAKPENLPLVPRLDALRAAGGQQPVRDVFAPSPAWFDDRDAATGPSAARVDAFRLAHTLKAVVAAGKRGQAMVNDRLLAVGQSIDGWRLAAVGPGRATFVAGTVRAELTLPQASGRPNS